MNTVLLQYALEVQRTGSITRAAASLCMDQPNLSKAIRSLEEGLGAPIFKRTPKGMVPTSRGRVFLEQARNVLIQIEEMEHLYKPDELEGVNFSVSMPRSSYLSLAFSRVIRNLGSQEPMNVWLRETSTENTLKEVESGEYNLGVIQYPVCSEKFHARKIWEKGLAAETVFEYELRLLFSPGHPLAGKEDIEEADLMPYMEIAQGEDGLEYSEEWSREKESPESLKRIYVFDRESQLNLLSQVSDAYMWTSPVPQEALSKFYLVERRCKKSTRMFRDVLIYRKGYSLTAWDREFLGELKKVTQNM